MQLTIQFNINVHKRSQQLGTPTTLYIPYSRYKHQVLSLPMLPLNKKVFFVSFYVPVENHLKLEREILKRV